MKFNSNKFLLSLILPQIFGAIGSIFTFSSIRTWYFTLIKPSFNPPGWIFGPVWAILFILMGIAFYFIWMNNSKYKKLAIIFYFIQLIFNLLWSLFFFKLHSPLFAFIDIIILWLLIIVNITLFFKIDKKAGFLLIPYILWVSFASILNFAIILLN